MSIYESKLRFFLTLDDLQVQQNLTTQALSSSSALEILTEVRLEKIGCMALVQRRVYFEYICVLSRQTYYNQVTATGTAPTNT